MLKTVKTTQKATLFDGLGWERYLCRMKKLVFVISLLFVNSVFALTAKEKVFRKVFHSDKIGSTACGANSELLIKEWKKAGLDTSKSELWHVTNKGYQYFALVKYYQNRFSNFVKKPYDGNSGYTCNDTGGWYFHVFVVDNGKVYDSSYKKRPTVVNLRDYIYDMFVLKSDIGQLTWQRRSMGLKAIKDYQVKAFKNKLTGDGQICGTIDDFAQSNNMSCF